MAGNISIQRNLPRPHKILHVLRAPRAEGTVKLALDLFQTREADHEVFILSANPPELTEALRGNARWIQIDSALPSGRKKFIWMAWRTWKVCRERKPDLVICWPNGFGAFVLLGAALAGVRGLITHAGNPPTLTFKGRAYTIFTTWVVWAVGGKMVCCSNYVARQFARSPGACAPVLRMVYNCAPVAFIRDAAAAARAQRQDHRPRLIMVATLELHKDHGTLLKAMPAVIRAVPSAQLWLAGDGSLRERLENLSASLGLTEAVVFLGSRRDVPALLGQSNVFVFSTTREEGLGTVLIEALAAGLPVVASDVPACRETLAGGRWGTLVPPANPEALAAALIASLQAKPVIEPNGQNDYLQQFSPSCMIAAYVAATA
jgi:glycosyltransferase involved in cell wall biosynthesis